MAAQAARTNDCSITRSSTSTSTTTLTPSTKSYTTLPSSQNIHSSSSSSPSAVAPTLVDAFASLAVEVPLPQQQEVAFRTANLCSQNASQSAEPRSVIATRSTEPHSLTTTQLAESRPLASARSTRTNRRDDSKRQDDLKRGTKVHSDPVDSLVKGIGAVQIHQPLASTHSQTTSPPVLATPPVPKRSRSDYEEESPIDECLAKLYLNPPPPPPATSISASTSTRTVKPLPTTTKTTSTSISHNRPAKTSSKNVTSPAGKPVNVEADGEPDQDIPLHHLIMRRISRDYSQTHPSLTNDPPADFEAFRRLSDERNELNVLYFAASSSWRTKNSGSTLLYGEYFDFGQQRAGRKRSKSQLEADEVRVDIALHSLRVARQYQKLVAAAGKCEVHQCHAAYMQHLHAQSTEPARIELQRKYKQASEQCKKAIQDARSKATQQHQHLSLPPQNKQGLKERAELQYHDSVASARSCESRQRHVAYMQYLNAQPTQPARIELQRKYEQASEQRLKSVQDAWNKAKQQHRQLSQSYHQTPSQYKQGLEDLASMASYPWLLMDLGAIQSSSLDSVSGSSRKDRDKTSKDQERRKRVKHDDIKQEPADEKMSDAATASTSLSTTTNAASTTSTFSTSSSGHTIAAVTLDMQHRLTFNPITATSQ